MAAKSRLKCYLGRSAQTGRPLKRKRLRREGRRRRCAPPWIYAIFRQAGPVQGRRQPAERTPDPGPVYHMTVRKWRSAPGARCADSQKIVPLPIVQCAMRTTMVVVITPLGQLWCAWSSVGNHSTFRHSSRKRPLKLSIPPPTVSAGCFRRPTTATYAVPARPSKNGGRSVLCEPKHTNDYVQIENGTSLGSSINSR